MINLKFETNQFQDSSFIAYLSRNLELGPIYHGPSVCSGGFNSNPFHRSFLYYFGKSVESLSIIQ